MKFYKALEKHRPDEMKNPEAPFYLAVKQKRRADDLIWYMRSPLGKNQLGKFLSDAVSAAGLQSGKIKLSNHSVTKTSIGRLLDANFPENYEMQLSDHKFKRIQIGIFKPPTRPTTDVGCTQQTKPASDIKLYPHKSG